MLYVPQSHLRTSTAHEPINSDHQNKTKGDAAGTNTFVVKSRDYLLCSDNNTFATYSPRASEVRSHTSEVPRGVCDRHFVATKARNPMKRPVPRTAIQSGIRAFYCLLRTDASVQRRATFNLPDVKQRQLVLSISRWAKTAQLKGSFNETSNLHFCSSSHISGRCMREVRRGIQSRRNIAVGSTDGRVISPRLTAHFNNHIASTVPHQRGGFLRFPIQILSSQIQKDIPCSTKS